MNRILSEGRITKIKATTAYLMVEKFGLVQFPLSAARIANPSITDFGSFFTTDEIVVFTAQKTGDRYVVLSGVKRSELIFAEGSIIGIEDDSKYCYALVPKYGRVFIPYSSRKMGENVPWHGQGVACGMNLGLKIFRQPEINGFRYVAWSISFDPKVAKLSNLPSLASTKGSESSSSMSKLPQGIHGQLRGAEKLDHVSGQLGVIVIYNAKEALVYSAISGHARVPVTERKEWMKVGRWVKYDAVPFTNDKKIAFRTSNVIDMGTLYPIIPTDDGCLKMRLQGVVNRISMAHSNCWVWNDFIGRVYVLNTRGFRQWDSVDMVVFYSGTYDDVPWNVKTVDAVDEPEASQIRLSSAQLLKTDDEWVVTHVCNTGDTFYGFMDNARYGSAFFAHTDLNDTDEPPTKGSKVRASVYYQQRDQKHMYRGVLVTPLDDKMKPVKRHPKNEGTGKRNFPTLIEQPVENKKVVSSSAAPPGLVKPQPVQNRWNMANLGPPCRLPSPDPTSSGQDVLQQENDYEEEKELSSLNTSASTIKASPSSNEQCASPWANGTTTPATMLHSSVWSEPSSSTSFGGWAPLTGATPFFAPVVDVSFKRSVGVIGSGLPSSVTGNHQSSSSPTSPDYEPPVPLKFASDEDGYLEFSPMSSAPTDSALGVTDGDEKSASASNSVGKSEMSGHSTRKEPPKPYKQVKNMFMDTMIDTKSLFNYDPAMSVHNENIAPEVFGVPSLDITPEERLLRDMLHDKNLRDHISLFFPQYFNRFSQFPWYRAIMNNQAN